jgi:hypothetical protein
VNYIREETGEEEDEETNEPILEDNDEEFNTIDE